MTKFTLEQAYAADFLCCLAEAGKSTQVVHKCYSAAEARQIANFCLESHGLFVCTTGKGHSVNVTCQAIASLDDLMLVMPNGELCYALTIVFDGFRDAAYDKLGSVEPNDPVKFSAPRCQALQSDWDEHVIKYMKLKNIYADGVKGACER